MVFTRAIGILILVLGICLMNDSALAVDDDDAMIDMDNHTATFTGTWTKSTNRILYYGDNYRYAVCNGNDSDAGAVTANASFNSNSIGILPDITGRYAVYVRWVTHPNRTNSARYRIYRGNTSTLVGSCTLNQEQRGGEWVFCDNVQLSSSVPAIVEVGNNCELNQIVVADAVRFVRITKDGDDIYGNTLTALHILDEPGIEYVALGSKIVSTISSVCSSLTDLASISLTAPTSGYIHVQASGIYNPGTASKWVRVGIDDASGGSTFDNLAPYLESDVIGVYYDEKSFSLNIVYNVSAGTKTYYLKACREDTSTTGTLWWDYFTATFYPTRY
ncbi:MAG: hypothetical protein L6N96_03180 [Candidatus Methylarchaceae archaeon HK02M2]|nr:hypothetical protein [Candidatus Methylarchaceae archaeon HK02M2]